MLEIKIIGETAEGATEELLCLCEIFDMKQPRVTVMQTYSHSWVAMALGERR